MERITMEPDSFIGLLAKWLFGIDPSSITWIHVSLAFVMSSFGWGPFVVKYLWYRQHMRFLTTATGPLLVIVAGAALAKC